MDFGARRNALECRSLLLWACSSAGRAPALQESRQNHTSAASGVAYAETHGATNLFKWTDIGPKACLGPLGHPPPAQRVSSDRRNVQAAPKPTTLRLRSERTQQ